MENKKLTIYGNPAEVRAIINSLMRRYGNITIEELLTKMNRKEVVLV